MPMLNELHTRISTLSFKLTLIFWRSRIAFVFSAFHG
jgi:hypothetical protein